MSGKESPEYSPSSPQKNGNAVTSTSGSDKKQERFARSQQTIDLLKLEDEENMTRELLHRAQNMAQDALRAEASLRAQLKSQMKAREAKKSKSKQPGKSRASKRLENCPGVTSPSLSGKRMEPIPVLFVKEKKKQAEEAARKLSEPSTPQLATRDVTGDEGANAGLLGLDTTFSFSPRDYDKVKAGDLSRAFDKMTPYRGRVTLTEHLVKMEKKPKLEPKMEQDHSLPSHTPPRAGRPTPKFVTKPKPEPGNDTIPWEKTPTNGISGGRRRGVTSTASHCHHLTQVVAVAPALPMQHQQHHHHHFLHQPTPAPSPACFSTCSTAPLPQAATQVTTTVWCSDSDKETTCRASMDDTITLQEMNSETSSCPDEMTSPMAASPARESQDTRVTRAVLKRRKFYKE